LIACASGLLSDEWFLAARLWSRYFSGPLVGLHLVLHLFFSHQSTVTIGFCSAGGNR
jgi:hypothetical protein